MKMHELKTVNPYFTDVYNGYKKFEIRKNNRDFKVGDILWLREYTLKSGFYSGRSVLCNVGYIIPAGELEGLSPEYCAMGIDILDSRDVED